MRNFSWDAQDGLMTTGELTRTHIGAKQHAQDEQPTTGEFTRTYGRKLVQTGAKLMACMAFSVYIPPQWRAAAAVSDTGRALWELINGV
jgi:hypothetical protein